MTQISEIHGNINPNEWADRSKMVQFNPSFIPYLALTKGEMQIYLLAEQARIFSAAYPELREYKKAKSMLENALNSGLSNGVNFVGALHSDLLQQVAREINAASKKTAPASNGILIRDSISQGVKGIGEVVDYDFTGGCIQYATRLANAKFGFSRPWSWWEQTVSKASPEYDYYNRAKLFCKTQIEIQDIVNSKITDASHHVVYYNLVENFPLIKNSLVATKHLLHIGGIQGLANATGVDRGLMGTWTETSILKKNTIIKAGPLSSVQTSFSLSPDSDRFNADYLKFIKQRGGSSITGIGEPISVIIIAIATAITAAAAMAKELNAKKVGAMAAAQNYGTVALEAKPSDFNEPPGYTSGNSNLITFGLLAAGAYLLLDDKK